MKPQLLLFSVVLVCLATPLAAQSQTPETAPSETQNSLKVPDDNKVFFPKAPPGSPIPLINPNIKVERQPSPASTLFVGMTRAQVVRAMGQPSLSHIYPNIDAKMELLTYSSKDGFTTHVDMVDGKLVSVTSKLKIVTDYTLPEFARGLEIGMSREQVVKLLGKPIAGKIKNVPGIAIDRLEFSKGNQRVTVLLRRDLVEGFGSYDLERPPGIIGLAIPATPSVPQEGTPDTRIRIGMTQEQVVEVYGKPNYIEPGSYKGQTKLVLGYGDLQSNAFTSFTFIDNALTRFAFLPKSEIYHAKQGGTQDSDKIVR